MRAVIITIGTQGDVSPYTSVGSRLRVAGLDVTIVTHKAFADYLADCGLDFSAIPGDPRQLVSSPTFQDWTSTGRTKRSIATRFGQVRTIMRDVTDLMNAVADELADAVPDDTDVMLLAGTAAPLAYHLAEGRGLPSMGVHWGPTEPTGAFPPTMGADRSLGWVGNRIAGEIGLRITDGLYREAVRRLRTRLGLRPVRLAAARRRQASRRWPVHHGYSPVVLPRPRDWRPGMEVVGYWWAERPTGWEPPAALVDFLDSGPAPVFIGLGSMSPGDSERFSELAAAALRRAGVRGMIQSGWAQLSVHTDDVLTIGQTPYDWLFPRMAAVVHHAGAGTVGAALRAGVPTFAVPVIIDQPFWAGRIAALGVGPPPIPFWRLSKERLAAAISAAVSDPGYRERAKTVSAAVNQEDGAGRVLEEVRRLLD